MWVMVLASTTYMVVGRITTKYFYSVICWYLTAILGQLAFYFYFLFLLIFYVSLLNDQQANLETNYFQRR